jgi:hypothetical protein
MSTIQSHCFRLKSGAIVCTLVKSSSPSLACRQVEQICSIVRATKTQSALLAALLRTLKKWATRQDKERTTGSCKNMECGGSHLGTGCGNYSSHTGTTFGDWDFASLAGILATGGGRNIPMKMSQMSYDLRRKRCSIASKSICSPMVCLKSAALWRL